MYAYLEQWSRDQEENVWTYLPTNINGEITNVLRLLSCYLESLLWRQIQIVSSVYQQIKFVWKKIE